MDERLMKKLKTPPPNNTWFEQGRITYPTIGDIRQNTKKSLDTPSREISDV